MYVHIFVQWVVRSVLPVMYLCIQRRHGILYCKAVCVYLELNSACRFVVSKPDLIVLKHIIQQYQYKVIHGDDDVHRQRIHVWRSHLCSDIMRAFAKATFNVSKMLKVTFIGEPSVVEGGPRQEFFQLAVNDIIWTFLWLARERCPCS